LNVVVAEARLWIKTSASKTGAATRLRFTERRRKKRACWGGSHDVAIKAYREGKLPFPDGTIIARLAWDYVPLEESGKAFGRLQSFVAGPPKNGV
jgi:hypothetical protein